MNNEAHVPTPAPPGSSRWRVAMAGMVGTLIEIYDFVIYGTAAALVFPHTFFPSLGAAAGAVASIATLGVAFVARPLGGALFGHFGDRLGRKKTLVASLLLMGITTALVGAMPSAAQIGVVAPILLVVLRFGQGLAAGGEWAGAALFSAEHAPTSARGLWTMWPQIGATIAVTFGNGTFLITALSMSPETFVSWGWRIPFISSILLAGIGLWIRFTLDETPVFRSLKSESRVTGLPLTAAIRHQWPQILMGGGLGLTSFTVQYVAATYLVSEASKNPVMGRVFALSIGALAGVVLTIGVIGSGMLCDRFGRRRLMAIAHVAGVIWPVFMFVIVQNGSRVSYAIAVLVAMFIAGWAYGPLAALLTELFQTRFRQSAVGLAYNLTGIVGGGIMPVIAGPVIGAAGPIVFGAIVGGLSVVALICTVLAPETKNSDLVVVGGADIRSRTSEYLPQ